MDFYLEGQGKQDLFQSYNVRIERYKFKYEGAQILCARRLGLVFGALSAGGGFLFLGIGKIAFFYLFLMVPLIGVSAYLISRAILWFVALGPLGHIDLDLPNDCFTFPVCHLGFLRLRTGKFSEIKKVSMGENPNKKRMLHPVYLSGKFGRWSLYFPTHSTRDFGHKAFSFSKRLLTTKDKGKKTKLP